MIMPHHLYQILVSFLSMKVKFMKMNETGWEVPIKTLYSKYSNKFYLTQNFHLFGFIGLIGFCGDDGLGLDPPQDPQAM